MVIVRSRGSGVWMGVLREVAYPAAGMIVRLDSARRLWSWSGAKECSELALTGPTGGNIGCVSAPVVAETLEMHECAPAAVVALGKVPVWTPEVMHDGSGSGSGDGSGDGDGDGDGSG